MTASITPADPRALTLWSSTATTSAHSRARPSACTTGRQLFDDFGVDTDSHGLAHIAFSHDSPTLGGPETYTGSAVQTGGKAVGEPNN